jgi:hypothetical protein
MMAKLGHTPYINKQIVELAITSLATSTMFGVNYVCSNPKMTQFFMNMSYKALKLL